VDIGRNKEWSVTRGGATEINSKGGGGLSRPKIIRMLGKILPGRKNLGEGKG